MLDSIWVTAGFLAADIIAIFLLLRHLRRPVDARRISMIPRSMLNLAILILIVTAFAIAAHIVSLLTGEQLKPRRPKGM